MRATIKDVAIAAGAAASTVSRALTMPELALPRTGERVPDLTNPFFPGVVKGVQVRAREAADVRARDLAGDPDRCRRRLECHRADGMIGVDGSRVATIPCRSVPEGCR